LNKGRVIIIMHLPARLACQGFSKVFRYILSPRRHIAAHLNGSTVALKRPDY